VQSLMLLHRLAAKIVAHWNSRAGRVTNSVHLMYQQSACTSFTTLEVAPVQTFAH